MKKKIFLLLLFVKSGAYAATTYAAQEGLVERLVALRDTVNTGTTLVVSVSVLIGLALLVSGGLQLKKYSEDPRQTPISKPLIFIIAGSLIFGLSATSDTMMTTIFGENVENPTADKIEWGEATDSIN
jgi:hypothetical protein